MASALDIAIMINNYSHDIATAFLAVSGLSFWIIVKNYPMHSGGLEGYFSISNKTIGRLGKYSLLWVLVAGVPRILSYKTHEWSSAAGELQVTAILIKHVVMFLLVGIGLFYWLKIRKRLKEINIKDRQLPTPKDPYATDR